ncbi:MAG: DEAD/DEAH box helicase [gamma proteobacterium symbiont of Bathyaustriella thionipta]|nr:DEAD/DEAH box helicase [gamma proteobacterium symbiont of Bathyaustriella thionipta]MCU7950989.1 DEAD/DEAH box helicase [gamma proteobacterium symbiont of Bathyaustriella thionipta]MCU7951806.1 DEAD/DEAH box helicase [gamma proteobacterium symbiont of Bathyaustriella thionipta]MCU7957491.1 DEAD/DEAH box helicase [gamma proteobacterium symbiont of Bathyaustriella thionipta]MCU7967333.1 DEAD/DEAH box helicase [gamma proteobacterium symbiont of Bathyaustriella thionipta]
MSFTSLGLSAPILDAIAEQGYDTPSPIQAQAIPAVLEGKDIMAAAQTGTGKTAGFTLPILERLLKGPRVQANQARTLILTPTRELAAQVEASVATYGKNLPLRSTVVFGGVKINPQMMKLRRGVDILVATPGRLLDLYNQNAVRFDQLEVLVLDEADRMLDMGFIHDIRKIISYLPKKRQNLMFSATFSDDIRHLAKGMVNNPVEISVSPRNTTVESVKQWICPVDKKQKPALLMHLISHNRWEQVLVFSKTKHGANRLTKYLESYGIHSAAIHGNKSQGARTKALENFKRGTVKVLVATDIAARGLDIDQLPHVINFDLPNVPEDYVHRIGRTGRAGATGEAVSLVSADEFKLLSDIERLINQLLTREYIEGFDPVHDLPVSNLRQRPAKHKKPKRPKKPRVGHSDGQRSGENARGHKPTGKNKRHVGGQKRTTGNKSGSNGRGGSNKSSSQNTGEQKRRSRNSNKSNNSGHSADSSGNKQNYYRQGNKKSG